MQEEIEQTINEQLTPEILEVTNESYKHNVPSGAESHFKVTIVENIFADLSKIARYKLIHTILQNVLSKIHALSLHLYTPQEWQKRVNKPRKSPPCARKRQ